MHPMWCASLVAGAECAAWQHALQSSAAQFAELDANRPEAEPHALGSCAPTLQTPTGSVSLRRQSLVRSIFGVPSVTAGLDPNDTTLTSGITDVQRQIVDATQGAPTASCRS